MGKLRNELNGEPLWGLPHHISEELIDAHDITILRSSATWMFIIVMCMGFALGAYKIWPFLERKNFENAVTKSNELGGLMVDTNFGFGLVIALFVWIFMSVLVLQLIVRLAPMPFKGALFFGALKEFSFPRTGKDLQDIIQYSETATNAERLINWWCSKRIKKWAKVLLPIALLVSLFAHQETKVFSVYTKSGFYKSGLFSSSLQSWEDVTSVELGCNQTDEGGSLIYEIHANGKSFRIGDSTPVNDGFWFDNLEKIDAEIEAAGANFVRWKWLKRDPLHPKCLRGYYGELGPDGKARIDKILRIDEI